MSSLHIETVRAVDLERFFRGLVVRDTCEMLPISEERAVAQSRNPYADVADVGLLVGYDGNRIVGYLGLLPGLLRVGTHTRKIFWFSGWFVEPAYRQTSIGSLLLLKAFSLQYDLFITGLSFDSEGVLRAMRLPELGPLTYYQIELDAPVRLATSPLRLLRRLVRSRGRSPAWLDRAIERSSVWLGGLKRPLYGWLQRRADRALDGMSCERLEHVNGVPVPAHNGDDPVFYRGPEAIDWMLDHKWVPEGPSTPADERYRFLARQDVLTFVATKLTRRADGTAAGLVVMSVATRGGHTVARLLDFAVDNQAHPGCAWAWALRVASEARADRIEIPVTAVPALDAVVKLLVREQKRSYFCRLHGGGDDIRDLLPRIQLNLYDADQAFA